MIFVDTNIPGAVLIRPQRLADERGFFARTFCIRELGEHGFDARVVQGSVSSNPRRGTLRGMHFQAAPHRENKLVSCSRGAIYDVIVDLRPESAGYRTWLAFTLTSESLETLFIPAGCAHGFMTLEDDTVVHYDISEFYFPESARGFRFDDPAFGIEWPQAPLVISPRDLAFPPYAEGLDPA
jgi:dTDP-4-dehydrorhamnose 3,5-epimerase